MMDVKYTKEQRSAIYGRGGSILVGAAAGSGKTTVLSERIVSMLSDETRPIDASRILVMTFSKSAASDMKQKIKKKLNEYIIKNPDNKYLKKQQKLLKRARISTVHSFCAQLLREYFSTLDISPDFSIAEEGFTESMKQRALERALEQCYENFPDRMNALVNNFGRARSDREASDAVSMLYEFEQTLAWPSLWETMVLNELEHSAKQEHAAWEREARSQTLELLDEGIKIAESNIVIASDEIPDEVKFIEKLQIEAEYLKRLRRAVESWNTDLVFSILFESRPRVTVPRKINELSGDQIRAGRDYNNDLLKRLKERSIYSFSKDQISALQKMQYPLVKTLIDAKDLYVKALESEKKEKNFFEYNDLESYALRLLYDENGEVSDTARSVAACYDQIFIDEFQDTNERQKAIFDAISTNGDNLFYVGDVKQSIYSFRRADPNVFIKVREIYEPNGEQYPRYISLQHNFRSSRSVINSVNNIFDPLMSKKFGGVDYISGDRLEKYDGATMWESKDPIGMDLSLIIGDDDTEARYIALRIKEMLDSGYLVEDDESKEVRPCKPEDFCILLRTAKDNYERFLEALKALEIPCAAPGNDNFFDASEIRTMISLLKVVDNPRKDVELATVMLSPIGGYDIDELVKLRLIDRKKKLWQLLLERDSIRDEKLVEFIRMLRKKATRLSLEEFVGAAITDSNAEVLLTAPPESQLRKERLFALIDYASTFMKYGGRDLKDFVRHCDVATDQGRGPSMGGGDAYGVTITTVHKAKGLEWPIVFLADTDRLFNLRDSSASGVIFDSVCGIGMKLRLEKENGTYMETSPSFRTISQKKIIEAKAEEMRILYVALTRAKQKDLITATVSEKKEDAVTVLLKKRRNELINGEVFPGIASNKSNFISWILLGYCSSGFGDLIDGGKTEEHGNMKMSVVDSVPESLEKKYEERDYDTADTVKAINERIWYSYPDIEATCLPTKISVTQMVHGPSIRKVILSRPSFVRGGRLSATEQGTAVHRFMEICDLHKAASNPEKEVVRLKEEHFMDDTEADSINVKSISEFFDSDLGKKVLESKIVLREYAFLDTIDAEEYEEKLWKANKEKILLQGVADCVLMLEDHAVLIDFKTDRLQNEDDFSNRYRKQLYYYRNSLQRILDKPITECYLWSFYLGKAIPVDFD